VLLLAGFPAADIVAVDVPNVTPALFALLTSVVSVQDEPFHNSTCVLPVLGSPPTDIAAVVVPAAVLVLFAVFTSAISVQLVPFHCST